MVEVADVVLGRVLGAARVQQLPHGVLDGQRVAALAHDVVLVEYVAEEMPVVQLGDDLPVQLRRQGLLPLAVVAAQGDVQGHDVLHLGAVHVAVADRGAGHGEAVQEGLAPLLGVALEPVALARGEVVLQEAAGGLGAVHRHAQQQVVVEARAEVAHARRQVARQQLHRKLQQAVADPAQAQALEERIDPALQRKGGRHPRGAEAVDQQEGVLAVLLADVIGVAVDVLTGHRQRGQRGQQVAAHGGEVVGVIAADVEHHRVLLGEGVQAHGEQRQLAGRARGLVQARRVGVVARRGGCIDIAHVRGVGLVRGGLARVVDDVGGGVLAGLQAGEDVLRRLPQFDAQVVDQAQHPVIAQLRVQRQLGIGRAAPHQRATGVVAHSPQHRGADARGADHRVRFAPQRRQHLLQPVQGGPGQAHHLGAVVDHLHALQAQGADQHDGAVVVVAVGR